ncbi:hypothetical protein I7I50_08115 [Histoplasma capsulatum G186AR]|uniref:Uncharacterized protein n=1 Tax=Ajellomyces capsulatus TaxID=5037 RepID=A0A8H8CVE3_AJECA|nr:hypothetical protein I7I52_08631 [Histoplasma capsulatum]QSS68638.1 hypothetical protein I7I50_08115 [Histoplasma capsulatum G186AR]
MLAVDAQYSQSRPANGFARRDRILWFVFLLCRQLSKTWLQPNHPWALALLRTLVTCSARSTVEFGSF